MRVYHFPAGGVFPMLEQFTIPANTALVGAANPNDRSDKTKQQTNVGAQTWFVVPRASALCGDDPMCQTQAAKTACSGDPHTHRQGFLMSSNSTLKDINFQGADLGRAGSEGVLCGPGAIELPGCLSGDGCDDWGNGDTTGDGIIGNVRIENVRLSDAVQRADVKQMQGDCATGEALDGDGHHVRAHQVSVWVSKLPNTEGKLHSNILIENLVSMNSRADGLNVHGAVDQLILRNGHIENTGDDCIGIWASGARNLSIENMTLKNCAVTAGAQRNWGSCLGTYAFTSLAINGLLCYDPFLNTSGCLDRTHYSAIHLNKAYDYDCMPFNSTLSVYGVEYYATEAPETPLNRPTCAQCEPCCGDCSEEGFESLQIDYLDGSVPQGSCMSEHAGPGC
jgi:hypothetical protein